MNWKKWIRIFLVMVMVLCISTACGKSKEMNFQDYLDLGQKYLAEMKYEEAVVAFEKVLKTDPKQMSAYAGVAEALAGLEKKDEAITWLEQAVEIVETDYSKTDERFQATDRVLSQLLVLYEEAEETEKAAHVRQIRKEKGLAEEESAAASQIDVARPDLTKMKLEQVICYLYSADNESAKQWKFDELTEKEAGEIIKAFLAEHGVMDRAELDSELLNLDIEYIAGTEEAKIAKEPAMRFLNGIGIAVDELDFNTLPGLQEENGNVLSDQIDYSEFSLFAHIENMMPEADGTFTVTGNVGWAWWSDDAGIAGDLDPELIAHFKAVLVRSENSYLDGYAFTQFECGSTDYSAEYSASYDASGEADGFANLLQDLYDHPSNYLSKGKCDDVRFTAADINHDGKTELIISLPAETEENACYGVWQWFSEMNAVYMVDQNPYLAVYYDQKDLRGQFNMLEYTVQGESAPDWLYYKYSKLSGRYIFWNRCYNPANGIEARQAFDREVDAPDDQQLDLKWKDLTQGEIDNLRKNGIWETEKVDPERVAQEAHAADRQRNVAFAEFLKNACQNPAAYLNSEAYGNPANNRFAVVDINQDGKNELLVEYETETNPWILTGIWQWDEGSEGLALKDTLRGKGQYYSNGVVSIDVPNNHTNGEVVWPYQLYRYDVQYGKYEYFADAFCTDTEFGSDNGAYNVAEDLDHDGVIYHFRFGDEGNDSIEEAEPHTKAEYDAFVAQYTPEDQEMALDWQALTLENAARLAE